MLRKPTQRKEPKKYNKDEPPKMNKNVTIPQRKPLLKNQSIPEKVQKLQKNLQQLQTNALKPELQELLIQEIKGIKSQLKEIKYHIGMKPPQQRIQPQEEEEEEQNIQFIQHQEAPHSIPYQQEVISSRLHQPKQQLTQKKKQLLDMGRIQPYMKDFKMDPTKNLMPYYQGYHKKSSKPVIIKYCNENQSMDPIFNLYERLWKNIVKAKHICINKVYDLNEPLAAHVLVIEANKLALEEIKEPLNTLLVKMLRCLQFFHECGYLYRNVHPSHVMQSFEDNIVFIDFKNVRKFVDIKGRHLQVSSSNEFVDEFASNARIRGVAEGRKDDLECLGYLALFMLEGALPWNIKNIIEMRTSLTLKQLFGRYGALFEYMLTVVQMPTEETPNYDRLAEILKNGAY